MHRFFDWLVLALYVAIIFLLVRPRSQGPALVDRTFNGITNVIKSVTGGGGWD